MNTITIFGITVTIDPVAFTIPGLNWDVYWYGIFITIGFALAVFYAGRNAKRFDLDFDKIINCILVVLPVSIICARLYYMIFAGTPITEFFDFSSGHGFSGLAIYGGVIGAAISSVIMCKIFKLNILSTADITAIGFLIGQSIGRWGNFVNQEAYGVATGSDWFGMTGGRIALETGSTALVHPCFLYESVWCFLGFLLLHHFSKKRKFNGQIALMYCAWYGAERAVVEGLRTDSLMLGGIRVSQLLSVIICVAAVIILAFKLYSIKKREADAEAGYVSIIGENPDDNGDALHEAPAETAHQNDGQNAGRSSDLPLTKTEPGETSVDDRPHIDGGQTIKDQTEQGVADPGLSDSEQEARQNGLQDILQNEKQEVSKNVQQSDRQDPEQYDTRSLQTDGAENIKETLGEKAAEDNDPGRSEQNLQPQDSGAAEETGAQNLQDDQDIG